MNEMARELQERWKRLKARIEEMRRQERCEGAGELAEEVWQLFEQTIGKELPLEVSLAMNEAMDSLSELPKLCHSQGKLAEEEVLYGCLLRIEEKCNGSDHPVVGLWLVCLAGVYKDQGRYSEAEALYQRAVAIEEKAHGPEDRRLAGYLYNLAELYLFLERYTEADPLYRRAIAIWEKRFARYEQGWVMIAETLEHFAECLRQLGREGEAALMVARAERIRSTR